MKKINVIPLGLMLFMLIASAWLEPAPRPVARGLCVWFDGAMVNCLQRQRLGERLPIHSLARRETGTRRVVLNKLSLTSTSVVTIAMPDRRNCAMSAATR